MIQPIVSIVIPTYNSSLFVKDSIYSALQQTYSNIEIIVVDDGSTDSTLEVVYDLMRTDSRINILKKRHSGNVGKNSNDAVRVSNGEYIAKLDSDDMWHKDKLKQQIKFISDYKIICSNARKINETGKVISNEYYDFESDLDFDLSLLLKHNYVIASTILINKKIFWELGGYEQELGFRGEDYDLWLRAAQKYKIKYINDALIDYRIHSNNLSMKSIDEKINLLENTIIIRSKYLDFDDIETTRSATSGIRSALNEQCRLSFKSKNYSLAFDFGSKLLKMEINYFSLRFFKIIFFLIYCYILKLIK